MADIVTQYFLEEMRDSVTPIGIFAAAEILGQEVARGSEIEFSRTFTPGLAVRAVMEEEFGVSTTPKHEFGSAMINLATRIAKSRNGG